MLLLLSGMLHISRPTGEATLVIFPTTSECVDQWHGGFPLPSSALPGPSSPEDTSFSAQFAGPSLEEMASPSCECHLFWSPRKLHPLLRLLYSWTTDLLSLHLETYAKMETTGGINVLLSTAVDTQESLPIPCKSNEWMTWAQIH